MAWNLVIQSGSNPQFQNVFVDNVISASIHSGSFVGEGSGLTGIVSASYALTASYFDGQSHAVHSQVPQDVTWSFVHNLNNETPNITVWDNSKEVVIPQTIRSINANSLAIYFPVSQSGYAIASNGTILGQATTVVSASYAISASYAPGSTIPSGLLSSSAQIASDISGSFVFPSSSFSTRVSTLESKTVFSGSLQGNGSQITGVLTSSFATTSSYIDQIFSRGGTIANLTSGVSTTGSYMVWRAPYTCRVVNVYGKKVGSGTPQINAARSGSGGFAYHSATNLSLSSEHRWFSVGSLTNINYNTNDSLEIIVTGSGAQQIIVQVDFRK